MSLSQDLAPHTSSPKDVTEDVLVSSDPPAFFHHSCECEMGEDLESASELNMSITPDVEHRDLDDSKDISQGTCEEKIEPTILEFNDDILSVEYKSFACGFDDNESFDEGFYAKYESFSLDPIQSDFLFESCQSEFLKSDNLVVRKLI